jgi:hypothetical protein
LDITPSAGLGVCAHLLAPHTADPCDSLGHHLLGDEFCGLLMEKVMLVQLICAFTKSRQGSMI